ncbi:DUF6677 family protein [Planctomycetota bacterium]
MSERLNKPVPLLCLLAGLVVPGIGHLLLGSRRRGVQFLLVVCVTFGFGLLVTSGHAVSWTDHRFAFFCQVLTGLPAALGVVIDLSRGAVGGSTIPPIDTVARLDLGILFTMVAGLLNLLIAHDAYERAQRRRVAA